MNEIDFTNCKIVLSRAYNGANGKKLPVLYNDDVYMLKFPPSASNKPNDLSYSNSCISEHIGSNIYSLIGTPAQTTVLGTYNVGGKVKIVCACKDFALNGKIFYDFASIKNTVINSETNGYGTELLDVLNTIENQKFISPTKLNNFFWDMFIVDALLGNFDRHNGNWGFLIDRDDNCTIAPVFDCGSCLLPQADDKIMESILNDENELNARIYVFPNSILKNQGNKINYYNFINSLSNEYCNDALIRIFPKINVDKINNLIDDVPYITDLQKSFYKIFINARYEKILLPAYQKLTTA